MRRFLFGALLLGSLGLAQLGADDVFTMQHLGTTVKDSGGGVFLFKNKEYKIQWDVGDATPNFQLYNNTNAVMRLYWSDSALVLPSGRSSSVVPGNASWATRNNAFPATLIPPRASIEDAFYAINLMDFDDRLIIKPVFNTPLENKLSFRTVMSLEINGKRYIRDFVFYGKPRPTPPTPPLPTTRPQTGTASGIVRFINPPTPYFSLKELTGLRSGSIVANGSGVTITLPTSTIKLTISSTEAVVTDDSGSEQQYALATPVLRHSSGVLIAPEEVAAFFGCQSLTPPAVNIQLNCDDSKYTLVRY